MAQQAFWLTTLWPYHILSTYWFALRLTHFQSKVHSSHQDNFLFVIRFSPSNPPEQPASNLWGLHLAPVNSVPPSVCCSPALWPSSLSPPFSNFHLIRPLAMVPALSLGCYDLSSLPEILHSHSRSRQLHPPTACRTRPLANAFL